MPWSDLQGFAGATGVGAILLLALITIAHALDRGLLMDVLAFAEEKSLLGAVTIPALAVSYVLGLLAMGAGHLLIALMSDARLGAASVTVFNDSSYELGSRFFAESLQEANILAGGAIALLILAIGFGLEARRLRKLKLVTIGSVLITLFCSTASAVVSGKRMRDASAFVDAIRVARTSSLKP